MPILDVLLGRPLASNEDEGQKLGAAQGIPVFGLDALGSAAYGPEAALTILIPLGAAGLAYIVPLTAAIVILLAIVYFSYRQTIAAYPSGGGSYTVAKENLGDRAGLLAAASLMLDYLLNVAVGISAGVGALVSAVPVLQAHTLTICLVILAFITVVNLRGTRESGTLFMAPTYLFVACLFGVIAWGAYQTVVSGGHPRPLVAPPKLAAAQSAVGVWILLKAFASGCTAMTGVEAVSNGVQAFREPVVPAARRTLTSIIVILIVLLIGIAYLGRVYHISATEPGQSGYQSVLSQLVAAIAGRGAFYYVTIASILSVLCLSANTSFADFPRLCRLVATDGFLPRSFANRGRRLVYAEGIWVLSALAAGLLILFGGVTDRLIPLFAIGAFLAFTMSQAGMVGHWRRNPGKGARIGMFVNGLGAAATGCTVVVVLAAKFIEGAWVVVLLAPAIVTVMLAVRRHYDRVAQETQPARGFLENKDQPPIMIVPVETWNSVAQTAVRFALSLSPDVRVVHVECENTEAFCGDWENDVATPMRQAGRPVPELVMLQSPYRFVIRPILDYLLAAERDAKSRTVAVVIPELVERRWYHYFLHNQRAEVLTAMLLREGQQRIAIVNLPWYLRA